MLRPNAVCATGLNGLSKQSLAASAMAPPGPEGGMADIIQQVIVHASDLPKEQVSWGWASWKVIPHPGDQNPLQVDPAFLRLEPPSLLHCNRFRSTRSGIITHPLIDARGSIQSV